MNITNTAMSRPARLVGTLSPYPTVVTVWAAHQSPVPIDGYVSCSTTVTRRPAAMVITVEAEAITMAAPRGVVARSTALSSRRSSLVSSVMVCEFGLGGSAPPNPGSRPSALDRDQAVDQEHDADPEREDDEDRAGVVTGPVGHPS